MQAARSVAAQITRHPRATEKVSESAYDAAMSAEVSFDDLSRLRDAPVWLAWSERFSAKDPIEYAKWATRLRQEDRRSYKRLVTHRHATTFR
jgi:hypothetical protein